MAWKKKANKTKKADQVWLVTFGDLLTLLITFFVLLISMSSMDQKKLKDAFGFFSGAIGNLENGKGGKPQESMSIWGQISPMQKTGRAKSRARTPESAVVNIQRVLHASNRLVERLRDMRRDSSKGVHPIDENLLDLLSSSQSVQIRQDEGRTEINLHLGLVFESGRTKIRPESLKLLLAASQVASEDLKLRRVQVTSQEYGVDSRTFSPWELAAWRAPALVKVLKAPHKVPASVTTAGKKRYVQLFFEATEATGAVPESSTKESRGAP